MSNMESIIETIRNILRLEGIHGMDSVNHCVIFVTSRMLTKKMCSKIGIDTKYAFENIIKIEPNEKFKDQIFYDKIYDGSNECLMGQFYYKFGFESLKFKVKSIQNLKNIYKELKKLDTDKLSNTHDLIGMVYELHLKTGASNARDLGQFYTHRKIIEYMIKLCDPKLNEDGTIESVIDPTMGTGGFLTMTVKYLNEKYPNKIDWKKNKQNIKGFDIDATNTSLTLLNLLLEMGQLCKETIRTNDTLNNDFLEENKKGKIRKVDVLLANEPMGVKNIIYDNCCDRIKKIGISGKCGELLFLQLFVKSLKKNGRCAVIVPNGVLSNESNQALKTRIYLMENTNLKKIVNLEGDFFVNTGVKTAILFFVNDGNNTTEVEFSSVSLENNEVIENSIIKTDIKDIQKNNYSLFVNKYTTNPIEKIEGLVYKKLGEVCDINQGSSLTKKKMVEGKYDVIGGGKIIGKNNQKNRDGNDFTLTRVGDININYIDGPYYLTDNGFSLKSIKEENVITKYVYYFFSYHKKYLINLYKGAAQKVIPKTILKLVEIPIPSIEKQKKIVKYLDFYDTSTKTSEQKIKELKKANDMHVNIKLTGADCEHKKLGEVCEFKNGKNITKKQLKEGSYPVVGGGKSPMGYHDKYNVDENTILCSSSGAYSGYISKYNTKIWASDCFTIKPCDYNKLDLDYLFRYLLSKQSNIYDIQKGAAQPHVYSKDIANIEIPIPSIEKQKEIVAYCEQNENTIKQLEEDIENNKKLGLEFMSNCLKSLEKNSEQKKNKKNKKNKAQGKSSKGDKTIIEV